jgi:MFS family permease
MWMRLLPQFEGTSIVAPAGLIAGSLLCGFLIDRWNHKGALVAGLSLLSAGLWLLTLAPHLGILISCITICVGAGMSALAANAFVLPLNHSGRPPALALLNLLLPVGFLCSPILSPAAISYSAAIVATLALACATVTFMPRPELRDVPAVPPGIGRILMLALILAMYGFLESAIWTWHPHFFNVAGILDEHDGWLVMSYCVPLGLIIGRAGYSRVLLNLGAAPVLHIGSLTTAFATALMLLAHSPAAAWTATFLVGVAASPILPVALAVSYGSIQKLPAMSMAVVLSAGFLGVAVSTPIIRQLSGAYTLPTALVILPVLSIAMSQLVPKEVPRATGR